MHIMHGFTDIRYVEEPDSDDALSPWFARGEVEFDANFSGIVPLTIDAGTPLKVLVGRL